MHLGQLLQFYSWLTIMVMMFVVLANGNGRLRGTIARFRDRVAETSTDVTATNTEVGDDVDLTTGVSGLDMFRASREGEQFQSYRSDLEVKLQQAETPEEYLKVFFPTNNIDAIWRGIMNASYSSERAFAEIKNGTKAVYREQSSRVIKEYIAQHMEEMSCSHAKPVLIDMYAELNITRNRPVYIVPECTTVMRCDNGNCCSKIKPCVPKKGTRETVWKTFLVTELTLPGNIVDPAPLIRLVNYTFEEDTICDCLGPVPVPMCQLACHGENKRLNERNCQCECVTRCPLPYAQDDVTCTCDCRAEDGVCKKIKRGKKRVSDSECRCVSMGKCHQPPCKKGYTFSTQLCRCDLTNVENSARNPIERGTSNNNGGRRCPTEALEVSDISSSDQSTKNIATPRTDSSCEEEND